VSTPNLSRMADEGLRYNAFHVTAPCSPTRAALLAGRNHHAVGFGSIGELSTGCDNGLPVDRAYADSSPCAFTGTIENVVFDVGPHLTPEDRHAMHEHEHHAALAHGMGA
jgi:hypothetical protein